MHSPALWAAHFNPYSDAAAAGTDRQQVAQTGMGAVQQTTAAANPRDTADTALPGEFDDGIGRLRRRRRARAAAFEGTAPTAMLGPPPIPSAGTFPSAAPFTLTPGAGTATSTSIPRFRSLWNADGPARVMRADGMDKDAKPDAKRIAVPPVKNRAPVQGRITLPPTPVTKHVDGAKPVAAKRIIVPKPSSAAEPDA